MFHLSQRLTDKIRSPVTTLADIANLKEWQISQLPQGSVLVSTFKTFNYLSNKGRLPSVRPGTEWMVLTFPVDDGTPHLSKKKLRFSKVKSKKGSPRMRYSKRCSKRRCKSVCSVWSPESGGTPYMHSNCEIDDLAIVLASWRLGVSVVSNDTELKHIQKTKQDVNTESLDPLAKVTRVVPLVFSKRDGWGLRR